MSTEILSGIKQIIERTSSENDVKKAFSDRIKKDKVTRDENHVSHFCVYFAGYDSTTKEVFIGHHIKSGLWLFNGGHIDVGESPHQALHREIKEEWGVKIKLPEDHTPELLTITKINNPKRQTCKIHYDIWYFIPLNKKSFKPKQSLLKTEFHQTGWKTLKEAKTLIQETNTLEALKIILKKEPANTNIFSKDFNKWIVLKTKCHYKKSLPPMFKERDIWWVSIGVNIGYEENGKHEKFLRPVLVLRKFNRELFLGIPMSTKIKNNRYYIKVTVKRDLVSTLISQIRVFSAKRIQDKLAELDTDDFNKVKQEVIKMISFSPLSKQRSRG